MPAPSTVAAVEDRLLAAIPVSFPDELVFVRGSIWVKTDDGRVVQIDPETNSIVNDIKVDTTTFSSDFCAGLGTDGEHVWACSTRGDENFKTIDVVRIDPATGDIGPALELDKVFDQYTMPFSLGRIWVLTAGGSRLIGIDAATGEPGPAIELGARCFQAAASGRSLLVTCKLDNLLLEIDPERMQVARQVPISPAPWNIVATEDGVWVGLSNAVQRLDPETLMPVATFTELPGDKGLFATDDGIWVRLDAGFLYRIDPATNQVAEQIASGERFYNIGSLIVTPDAIWTTAGDDDLVLRLSLE